jgi:hypothetical protein
MRSFPRHHNATRREMLGLAALGVALLGVGGGQCSNLFLRHESLGDIQETPDRPLVLDVHTYCSVRRKRKQPQFGRMRDVEVDGVIHQRWFPCAAVFEPELLRGRAREPG